MPDRLRFSHTYRVSDDCDMSVSDMLEGAVARGIKILAVTDHYDPGYPDPEFPFIIDFDNYHKAMLEAREKYSGTLDLRIGLETGIMEGQFDAANEAISAFPYDVIIGSFHCHRSSDLYRYDFTDTDGPAMLEDFYTYMYDCLKEFSNYRYNRDTSAYWTDISENCTTTLLFPISSMRY